MIISRDSKLVKYAYLGNPPIPKSGQKYDEEKDEWNWVTQPPVTSLCSFFWRTIGATCIYVGFVTFASMLVYAVGKLIYFQYLYLILIIVTVSVITGFIYLLIKGWKKFSDLMEGGAETINEKSIKLIDSPFIQGALAVKRKICPIIEIK